jgi:hypothetical protein
MLNIDCFPKAIRYLARLFAPKNQNRFVVGKDSCGNTSTFVAERASRTSFSFFAAGLFIQRSVLEKIFLIFSVIFIHTVFSNAQATSSQAVEYIVDDGDSGFSVFGNWLESGSVNEFQGTSKYTKNNYSTAIWETVLEPGTYKVYAWWTAQKSDGSTWDRDERADYIVYHDGGTLNVKTNQTLEAAQWNLLGTVTMTTGTARVELSHDSESNGSTSADAIKWVTDNSGDQTGKKVILNWDPSPVSLLGYYIYYGATPETASQQVATLSVDLGTIDALDPKWSCDLKNDLGVLPGKQVCFRVKAYDGFQLSDYSEAACTIY